MSAALTLGFAGTGGVVVTTEEGPPVKPNILFILSFERFSALEFELLK